MIKINDIIRTIYRWSIKPIYLRFFHIDQFHDLVNRLNRELSDCNTIIDLGCGYKSKIQYVDINYSIGVELFNDYLVESKSKNTHNDYIRADITKVQFKEKSVDAIILIDVIEHLAKDEGYQLLVKMEKWATKKIIIYTPNSDVPQEEYDGNVLQIHKFGWTSDEFRNKGYKVYGLKGLRFIRGEGGKVILEPKSFWGKISDISQKITHTFPKLAFALFCVKKLE